MARVCSYPGRPCWAVAVVTRLLSSLHGVGAAGTAADACITSEPPPADAGMRMTLGPALRSDVPARPDRRVDSGGDETTGPSKLAGADATPLGDPFALPRRPLRTALRLELEAAVGGNIAGWRRSRRGRTGRRRQRAGWGRAGRGTHRRCSAGCRTETARRRRGRRICGISGGRS